jgi:hypothetical protein
VHTFHRTPSIALVGGLAVAVSLVGFGCSPKGVEPPPPPKGPFPLAASDTNYYAPSGAMGDGATMGNLVASSSGCKERPPGARGDCFVFQYLSSNPYTTLITKSTGVCNWAGVFFQNPANNWGADPGLPVPLSKLTQMTAQVAVASGTELMTFQLGGIGQLPLADGGTPPQPANACPPAEVPVPPNYDVILNTVMLSVGTDWTKVTIPILARSATIPLSDTINLIGAFAWSLPSTPGLPKTIYVDDLFFE